MKSPVFLDTSCFIYLLEKHPKYFEIIKPIFTMLSINKAVAFTSLITVTEALTKPLQDKNTVLVENCLEAFSEIPNLDVVRPNYKIAVEAAKIRAEYNLNLPDAYQLAIAVDTKCKTFLTNDKKLKRFKEVEVTTLDELISK